MSGHIRAAAATRRLPPSSDRSRAYGHVKAPNLREMTTPSDWGQEMRRLQPQGCSSPKAGANAGSRPQQSELQTRPDAPHGLGSIRIAHYTLRIDPPARGIVNKAPRHGTVGRKIKSHSTRGATMETRDHPLCRAATPQRRPELGGANRRQPAWPLAANPNALLASLGLASLAVAKAT